MASCLDETRQGLEPRFGFDKARARWFEPRGAHTTRPSSILCRLLQLLSLLTGRDRLRERERDRAAEAGGDDRRAGRRFDARAPLDPQPVGEGAEEWHHEDARGEHQRDREDDEADDDDFYF